MAGSLEMKDDNWQHMCATKNIVVVSFRCHSPKILSEIASTDREGINVVFLVVFWLSAQLFR